MSTEHHRSPGKRDAHAEALETSTRRTHGEGWHERHDGLHLVKVKGSFHAMGLQHGALLRDEVRTGAMPYYRSFFEKLVGRAALGPLGPLVWPALQGLVGKRVGGAMPDFAVETIRGLAEGAGMPFDELFAGCTMPDSLLWLAARLMELRAPGPAVVHRLSLGLGCTSAIAWGRATKDGKLYHARNLDYHGVGVWPRSQTVLFHEPERGHRYVSVTAAGVAMGGVTAMNDAGLTLTVHQHMFSHLTKLGGMPVGVKGDVVMREATSLDEAEAILRASRPIGCWTYLVCDGKTNEVLCFEESPDRQRAYRFGGGRPTSLREQPADDTFAYANVYLDPELGESETNLYGSYWRHNQARHRRAGERLRAAHGAHDASSVGAILGDRGLADCRLAESIGMVMTVGSVVFAPADGLVWVGTGEAPTSRGRFVAFDLRGERRAAEVPSFQVDDGETVEGREAFEAYRQAYVRYLDEADVEGAHARMEHACALAPREPVYHYLRGLFALELRATGDAERAFTRAVELGHPHPERRAAFALWRARARHELGKLDLAKQDYRQCLGFAADPPVHAAARRELRRGWSGKRRAIELSLGDVVQP